MPKIDTASIPARLGSGYPLPFDAPCAKRTRQRRVQGPLGALRWTGGPVDGTITPCVPPKP